MIAKLTINSITVAITLNIRSRIMRNFSFAIIIIITYNDIHTIAIMHTNANDANKSDCISIYVIYYGYSFNSSKHSFTSVDSNTNEYPSLHILILRLLVRLILTTAPILNTDT